MSTQELPPEIQAQIADRLRAGLTPERVAALVNEIRKAQPEAPPERPQASPRGRGLEELFRRLNEAADMVMGDGMPSSQDELEAIKRRAEAVISETRARAERAESALVRSARRLGFSSSNGSVAAALEFLDPVLESITKVGNDVTPEDRRETMADRAIRAAQRYVEIAPKAESNQAELDLIAVSAEDFGDGRPIERVGNAVRAAKEYHADALQLASLRGYCERLSDVFGVPAGLSPEQLLEMMARWAWRSSITFDSFESETPADWRPPEAIMFDPEVGIDTKPEVEAELEG